MNCECGQKIQKEPYVIDDKKKYHVDCWYVRDRGVFGKQRQRKNTMILKPTPVSKETMDKIYTINDTQRQMFISECSDMLKDIIRKKKGEGGDEE